MRKKLAAVAVAATVALTPMMSSQAFAQEADDQQDNLSSQVSLSSGVGLLGVGAVLSVFLLEGMSSVANAPYCAANPGQCPNSLAASLSSVASSQIEFAKTQIPRVPTTVR